MNPLTNFERPLPSWEGISQASHGIDPVFLHTPLVQHNSLDAALGCRLVAKVETLNPIRSFKGRGASWFMRASESASTQPLVTASAGNFGQGLAYAARSKGRELTVFAATSANPVKVAAMRSLGATVVLEGDDFDSAKEAAAVFAKKSGGKLVIDGDNALIAEGAGTIAYELTDQHVGSPLDAVLVPLGNGALATGIGTWLKHQWPSTRVIAVAAAGAPAMADSWESSSVVKTQTTETIADGIAVRIPIPFALRSMVGTVDEVMKISEDRIIEAMRLIHETLGIVVEPAGAVGVAAVLSDPARWGGANIGTALCGSNIDPARADEWLVKVASAN